MSPEHYMEVLPGYEAIFNSAEKKGYSGTGVLSRVPMLSHTFGIGVDEHDHEGRVITCEFEDFYLSAATRPNSQNELRRLDYRMRWEDDFRAYLKKLDEKKPVVLCGDLNVAHEEIDLKKPQDQPLQRRFHRSGARQVFRTAGRGVYRHLPLLLPGQDRRVQLVELHRRRAQPQRGVAHRLFRGQSAPARPPCLRGHPRPDHGQRPLPGGTGTQIGGNWTDFIALEVPA